MEDFREPVAFNQAPTPASPPVTHRKMEPEKGLRNDNEATKRLHFITSELSILPCRYAHKVLITSAWILQLATGTCNQQGPRGLTAALKHFPQMEKGNFKQATTQCPYMYIHVHNLHYITLHYITLHYITLHYITLHYLTFLTLH